MAHLTETADFIPLFGTGSYSEPSTPARRGSPYSESRTQTRVSARPIAPGVFRRVLVSVRGSIFAVLGSYIFWLKFIVLLFLALLVTLYTTVIEPPTFKASNVNDNWWDHLHSLSILFNYLTVLILCMYVYLTLARWWSMRAALGVVQDGVLSVAWAAATFFPQLESMDTRKTLVRYAHALHELLWRSEQGEDDTEPDPDSDLVSLGFLTASEWSVLRGVAQPYVILVHWMSATVVRARAQNQLVGSVDVALTQLCTAFNSMKSASHAIETSVGTRQARPLTQLMQLLTFFALCLFALERGQSAGSEQLQNSPGWMAFDVLLLFALHFFYYGLIEVGVLLANPFADGPTQFPRSFFRGQLHRTTRVLVRTAGMLPSD